MFPWRKRRQPEPYDKTGKTPVLRASICTGERVDLREFLARYSVDPAQLRREW